MRASCRLGRLLHHPPPPRSQVRLDRSLDPAEILARYKHAAAAEAAKARGLATATATGTSGMARGTYGGGGGGATATGGTQGATGSTAAYGRRSPSGGPTSEDKKLVGPRPEFAVVGVDRGAGGLSWAGWGGVWGREGGVGVARLDTPHPPAPTHSPQPAPTRYPPAPTASTAPTAAVLGRPTAPHGCGAVGQPGTAGHRARGLAPAAPDAARPAARPAAGGQGDRGVGHHHAHRLAPQVGRGEGGGTGGPGRGSPPRSVPGAPPVPGAQLRCSPAAHPHPCPAPRPCPPCAAPLYSAAAHPRPRPQRGDESTATKPKLAGQPIS
jgi:hypothetical protein